MLTNHAMLMRLNAENDELNRRWVLNKPSHTLGRESDCDIYLPDRLVSRKHARIFNMKNRFFVEDLNSKNGTYINGQLITQAQALCDGDVLQIGLAYRLSFIGKDDTAPVEDKEEPILQLNPQQKEVRVCGQPIDPPLAVAQFALLSLLFDAQGHLVEYHTIANTVWGTTEGVTTQTIDSLIGRLRRRLAEINPDKTFIRTIRGKGVRINYF